MGNLVPDNLGDSTAQAIVIGERLVADQERVLGPDHPDTLTTRNNLALAYQDAGRLDEAIGLHEQTLAARERVLGADHPDTLHSEQPRPRLPGRGPHRRIVEETEPQPSDPWILAPESSPSDLSATRDPTLLAVHVSPRNWKIVQPRGSRLPGHGEALVLHGTGSCFSPIFLVGAESLVSGRAGQGSRSDRVRRRRRP